MPGIDVAFVGNAIVDVLASVDDATLARLGLSKGAMGLVSRDVAERLSTAMPQAVVASGGSGANTSVGASLLGLAASFSGRVADDPYGRRFVDDLVAAGVVPAMAAPSTDGITGRSHILVSPDGQRTMNTHLGASVTLGPDDLDLDIVRDAHLLYLEGYFWDDPTTRAAFSAAADAAGSAGRRVALTLSDAGCVARHRDGFQGLMRSGTVSIVLGNDAELRSLYDTDDLDAAIDALRVDCPLAAVTLGADGALSIAGGVVERVPTLPVAVVDTTGAGDMFAAGFVAGVVRGLPPAEAARLGCLCASEAVGHVGARPVADVAALARANGFVLG